MMCDAKGGKRKIVVIPRLPPLPRGVEGCRTPITMHMHMRRPGVEVNGVEPDLGQTALVLASMAGHAAAVRVLLACAEV